MANMTGGFSEPKDATEEIQKICDAVKPQVEEKTNQTYEEFIAVQYMSQVVNGTNYMIKVHVGGSSYLNIKVFQALPCHGGKSVLGCVEEGHTKEDPLKPF